MQYALQYVMPCPIYMVGAICIEFRPF